MGQKFKAVHVRHVQVGDHDGHGVVFQALDRLDAIRSQEGIEDTGMGLEFLLDQMPQNSVVIDNEGVFFHTDPLDFGLGHYIGICIIIQMLYFTKGLLVEMSGRRHKGY